tara:strand:- start:130 stop:492 length:363 start_codon:yes stop_codon:yes gene_type:complete
MDLIPLQVVLIHPIQQIRFVYLPLQGAEPLLFVTIFIMLVVIMEQLLQAGHICILVAVYGTLVVLAVILLTAVNNQVLIVIVVLIAVVVSIELVVILNLDLVLLDVLDKCVEQLCILDLL